MALSWGFFILVELMNTISQKPLPIKAWAEDDRPREKLLLQGRNALSDAELLAIIIGSGNRQQSALDLARSILSLTENNLTQLGMLSIAQLCRVKGIGEAKAITISAALELGRRRVSLPAPDNERILTSASAYAIFQRVLSDLPYEEFWIATLNRSNQIISRYKISEGGIAGTVVDTRRVLKFAIEQLASGILLAHNHPSGNLTPSDHDVKLTRRIVECAKMLDMQVFDHIIVGKSSYYSFADNGQI